MFPFWGGMLEAVIKKYDKAKAELHKTVLGSGGIRKTVVRIALPSKRSSGAFACTVGALYQGLALRVVFGVGCKGIWGGISSEWKRNCKLKWKLALLGGYEQFTNKVVLVSLYDYMVPQIDLKIVLVVTVIRLRGRVGEPIRNMEP